jgi:transcriptional regulator with XRE-family HTH domain
MSTSKKRGRPSKPPDLETLGGQIRSEREKRGLSPEQLMEYVGCSIKTISWGENNQGGGFSPQLRFAIAHELKSDFGDLEIREHLRAWLPRIVRLWEPEIRALLDDDEQDIDEIAEKLNDPITERRSRNLSRKKPAIKKPTKKRGDEDDE